MGDFLGCYFGASDGERECGEGASLGRVTLWRGRSSGEALAQVVEMDWVTERRESDAAQVDQEGVKDGMHMEMDADFDIPVASMSALDGGACSLKTVPLSSVRGDGWRRRLEDVNRVGGDAMADERATVQSAPALGRLWGGVRGLGGMGGEEGARDEGRATQQEEVSAVASDGARKSRAKSKSEVERVVGGVRASLRRLLAKRAK